MEYIRAPVSPPTDAVEACVANLPLPGVVATKLGRIDATVSLSLRPLVEYIPFFCPPIVLDICVLIQPMHLLALKRSSAPDKQMDVCDAPRLACDRTSPANANTSR
jgi:hypothetical protein